MFKEKVFNVKYTVIVIRSKGVFFTSFCDLNIFVFNLMGENKMSYPSPSFCLSFSSQFTMLGLPCWYDVNELTIENKLSTHLN